MALSISQTPNTAQHLLECGTEDCGGNCQFYCNPCLRPICDQCRDKHLQNPESKTEPRSCPLQATKATTSCGKMHGSLRRDSGFSL